MRVQILSAAPLPGSVKVARRPVKPFVLVRVQVWQPIYGRQADKSWLHLSGKQDRISSGVGALPTPSAKPFRSSKAEHPPDKRKTLERYQAEGPIISLDGVDSLHAWPKPRRCRCDSDSSGHATSVNAKQIERPALQAGPSRCESGHGRQCPRSSVRSERHRAKVEAAGATPAVDAICPCASAATGRVS